ncbi:amidohydrolase family protein [Streptomyces prunicolor]|uniref:amidohydrolase family protein n=1 Tax=Streptomyces prunicolor TaxID=67348 RepID=UPI00037B6722|nr:amidohydrolase family protein [Streptomyces prunicolor]
MSTATFIRQAAVFDGTRLLPAQDVLIDDGTITAVAPALAVPPGATVVDGAGQTLLPGLIDSHTHTTHAGQLRQSLVFGVTTELCMGGEPETSRRLRALARSRDDLADLRIATVGATAPHGHPNQLVEIGMLKPFPTVAGPEHADAFVADRVADGADHLKIFIEDGTVAGRPMPTMSDETVVALVAAAHEHGLRTAAHTWTRSAVRQAIACGVDILAHPPSDGPSDQDLIEAVAAAGAIVVATLPPLAGMSNASPEFELAQDPRLRPYADPEWLAGLDRIHAIEPGKRMGPLGVRTSDAADAAVRMFRIGVPLLAGTDGTGGDHPTTHGISYHGELDLLVHAGLTPAEALTAATAAPADTFGLDDRGRVAPGLRADLVLVNGSPLADITALRDITAIWRRGIRVDRSAQIPVEELV